MFNVRFAHIAVLYVVAAITGCASLGGDAKPVQVYTGAERPAEQVALLDCGFGLHIRAIDGDSRYQGAPITCKFALLPGQHEFRVGFESRDSGGRWRSTKEYLVSLTLVAGRKYSLHAFLDDKKKDGFPWRVTLADSSRKDLITVTSVREAP